MIVTLHTVITHRGEREMMRGGKMMNTIIATQQLMFFGNSMEKTYILDLCVFRGT
jgi:hypothetical protein